MGKPKHHLEIKSKMKESGIDRKELERKTKISEWKLKKIMEGKIVPTKDELKSIYEVLDDDNQISKEIKINSMRLSELLLTSMKEKRLNYDTAASIAIVDPQDVRSMIEASGIYLPPYNMEKLAVALGIKELEKINCEEGSDLLGKKIRGYRAVNGFTIEKLSEITKIHAGQLDMFEAGYMLPNKETQEKLAKAFKISLEEFIEDKRPCFDKEKYPTFASRLKIAREAYKLQIGAVCNYVGAGWNTVTNFENGDMIPMWDSVIEKFSKLFNCEFADLEEGTEEKTKEVTEEIKTEVVKENKEEVLGEKKSITEYWMKDLDKEEEKHLGRLIGMRIKELRVLNNKTEKEFTEAVGCTPYILKRLESGKRVPSIEFMVKIATYFNVSIKDICDNIEKLKDTTIDMESIDKTEPPIEEKPIIKEKLEIEEIPVVEEKLTIEKEIIIEEEQVVKKESSIKENSIIEEKLVIKEEQSNDGIQMIEEELVIELESMTDPIKEDEFLEKEEAILKKEEIVLENEEKVAPPNSQMLANMYDMLTDDGKRKLMNALWDVFENEVNRLPQFRRF